MLNGEDVTDYPIEWRSTNTNIATVTPDGFLRLQDVGDCDIVCDLFVVSKAGRNQRTVEFQRQFSGTVTVTPENRAITVSANLYRVLCGMDSLAKFVTKAILSIEAQITREIYTAFDTAMSNLPTGAGTANLKIAGYDKKQVISLAQKVSAYNNGAPAMFVGTKPNLIWRLM